MAGAKLTSRQQAQLAFLESLTLKMARVHSNIELIASQQADDVLIRGLGRTLNEIKAGAAQMSLNGLAETAGLMGTMSRRGGGHQMKVRGLRELFASLKFNYDAAVKKASTEQLAEGGDDQP